MDIESVIAAFETSADVKNEFIRTHAERVVEVGQLLIRAFRDGKKVMLFGNGGSATDASHIAAEFVGRYRRDRDPLPALALGTDMAALTCIANDYDYRYFLPASSGTWSKGRCGHCNQHQRELVKRHSWRGSRS